MSTALKRKLAVLERAVTPKADFPPAVLMLFEPGPEATAEERRTFAEQMAAGRTSDALVIVIAPLRSLVRQMMEGGFTYVGTEAEAMLLAAANQPGAEPGKSKLQEALEQREGKVMTPELAQELFPGSRWR